MKKGESLRPWILAALAMRCYCDPLLVLPRAGASAVTPRTRVRQVSLNEGLDSFDSEGIHQLQAPNVV